jgi:hypothetical protein
MVLNHIFPSESGTCFQNLTLTPLTTFSAVSDFAENLEPLQLCYRALVPLPRRTRASAPPSSSWS